MKFIAFLLYLIISLSCNGQPPPNSCDLLQQTLNNKEFIKLFKVDTTYSDVILIVDKYKHFKDCMGVVIIGSLYNSYRIDTTVPESNPVYYNCMGVTNDNDDTEQYFLDISNYYEKINVGVYFRKKNGKWVIDHFDSASTNWWEKNSPQNEEATDRANQHLKNK